MSEPADTAYAVAYGSALADWRAGWRYTPRTLALVDAAHRIMGVSPFAVHPSAALRRAAETYAEEFRRQDGSA